MKSRAKNNLDMQCNLKSYPVHLQDVASCVSSISDLKKLYGDTSVKFIYKKRYQISNTDTESSLTRNISEINQKICVT